jgi:hypothetical protein
MAIASYFAIKYYINKHRNKNGDGPQRPSQSKEHKQQQKKRKQDALCEHLLAACKGVTTTSTVNDDGAVHEKSLSSNYGQTIISDDECGPKHCPQCINEKNRARHYRRKIMLSLLIPNLMASMDLTIISTALPIWTARKCFRPSRHDTDFYILCADRQSSRSWSTRLTYAAAWPCFPRTRLCRTRNYLENRSFGQGLSQRGLLEQHHLHVVE